MRTHHAPTSDVRHVAKLERLVVKVEQVVTLSRQLAADAPRPQYEIRRGLDLDWQIVRQEDPVYKNEYSPI